MIRFKERTNKIRRITASAFLLALMATGLTTFTGKSAAQEVAVGEVPTGSLMLVRAWEPKTGELIGWMPMHRVALTLRRLAKQEGTPTFDLNEAVTVDFPYRPKDPAKSGRLYSAQETATFQGREWMPLEQAPNLVRIHNFIFYVRSIDFVESKWRGATLPSPSTQTQGK
jgi:hypothetical protein